MAHFAKLDENNIVTHVSVVDNVNAETEKQGIEYLKSIHGEDTIWVQTSYNAKIRKNFAGVGYFYDKQNDAFIAPKPFESWVLNSQYIWNPPIEYPNDGKKYMWNEDKKNWELFK